MSSLGCQVVICFICLFIASGSCDTLYALNNKRQENANLDLLVFDTHPEKLQVLPISGFKEDTNMQAGGAAVICQDIYHSFWNCSSYSYPRALFSWNIVANGPSYYQIDYGHHYVAVGCTKSEDTILLVATDEDRTKFSLYSVQLYGTQATYTSIARLPDPSRYGYAFDANIFSFNSDFSELWIALKDIKEGNGVLFIFDTKTGNSTQYSYPKSAGIPYFTLPQTLSEGSFKGALKRKRADSVEFVTLTINEKTNGLDVSVDIEDAPYLYGYGLPLTVCGDTGYVIDASSPVGKDDVVNAFNINTGTQIAQYKLADDAPNNTVIDMGGIACYQK
eukprot:611376_1